MADYSGEYGHPYPRVDQYGYPVPPVDQYGNPIPRESPDQPTTYGASSVIGTGDAAGVAPGDYGTASAVSGVVSPDGAAYTQEVPVSGGDVVVSAPDATTTYAYEGMVGSGTGAAGDQIQPAREEHTTLGETLRRSGSSSSSSSSSSEEGGGDGQGGRGRRKKSIKEKIKEKLPGSHKAQHEEEGQAAGTGTHAAGPHEKKGIMGKIKEKLPGHHH